MVGMTLTELRARIDALASDDGSYYVVCGRTGERPIPVAGKRFPDRERARRAAEATEQYRRTLRRYDPRTPHYDLVVCEATGPLPTRERPADGTADRREDPVPAGRGTGPVGRRTEFCHRVAAAVFESLSAGGHDPVESAVMDAYFEFADSVADPDELCLCLLEGLATEVGERLPPRQQAAVLGRAASRLAPAKTSGEAVSAALATLERRGLVGEFATRPVSIDLETGRRSVRATVAGYALSERDGRLPVLPVAVELFRHRPAWPPSALRVTDAGDRWRVTVELGEGDPDGLSTAPVRRP